MNNPQHVAHPGTWRYRIRIALPPLFLCAVGLYQIGRAHWSNQTPWKGGGFGMFSTVDSLQARRIRAYIVTQGGDLPIEIPSRLRTRANELRAAPNQQKIERLAEKLTQAKWLARDLNQESPTDVDSDWLHSGGRQYAPSPAAGDGEPDVITDEDADAGDPFQTTPSDDISSITGSSSAAAFYPVRVELWRLEFDQEELRMRATKWFECQQDPKNDPSGWLK